jgi:hypothetical protein
MTRFRRLIPIAGAAVVAAVTVACAPVTVTSFTERGVQVPRYQTYDWGTVDTAVPGDPRQPPAGGPAPVAVHDDRHVTGDGTGEDPLTERILVQRGEIRHRGVYSGLRSHIRACYVRAS